MEAVEILRANARDVIMHMATSSASAVDGGHSNEPAITSLTYR